MMLSKTEGIAEIEAFARSIKVVLHARDERIKVRFVSKFDNLIDVRLGIDFVRGRSSHITSIAVRNETNRFGFFPIGFGF